MDTLIIPLFVIQSGFIAAFIAFHYALAFGRPDFIGDKVDRYINKYLNERSPFILVNWISNIFLLISFGSLSLNWLVETGHITAPLFVKPFNDLKGYIYSAAFFAFGVSLFKNFWPYKRSA